MPTLFKHMTETCTLAMRFHLCYFTAWELPPIRGDCSPLISIIITSSLPLTYVDTALATLPTLATTFAPSPRILYMAWRHWDSVRLPWSAMVGAHGLPSSWLHNIVHSSVISSSSIAHTLNPNTGPV